MEIEREASLPATEVVTVPTYYAQVIHLARTQYDVALTFLQHGLAVTDEDGQTSSRAVPVARVFLSHQTFAALGELISRAGAGVDGGNDDE